MLTDPQPSFWQEKLYSSFCLIKYLILAMLGGEAIVAFLIMLRLRIAWAVTLKQVWGRLRNDANDGSSKNPHALRFGEGVAPLMPNVITDVVEAYRSPHGRDTLTNVRCATLKQREHQCADRRQSPAQQGRGNVRTRPVR